MAKTLELLKKIIAKTLELLKNTNSKLGKSIFVFNLPAGSSCPGKTEYCASICYAAKVERIYTNTKVAYAKNQAFIADNGLDAFVAAVVDQITRKSIKVVRIHSNGDFYSGPYALAWRAIAKACPSTVFFAYTRSWRVASILPSLEALRALPNVRLLASVDPSAADAPSGWRVARILSKEDSRAVKHGARVPSHIVCLEQAGKAETCGDCRICYGPGRAPIAFIQH